MFMLKIQTYLAESKIQGIGLFTSENIPVGQVVWRYDPRTTLSWNLDDWEKYKQSMPPIAFESIERFSYLNKGKWLINLDDSRFMNHSDDPNLGYDQEKDLCYAKRDIEVGEELTVRYSEFCETNTSVCNTCMLCGIDEQKKEIQL